jgi:catechol 2,3-dioxygenase-like lactoylglutathione lyase family enzyme
MRTWYCTVLGAHVVHEDQGAGLSFITFDDEHHRVAFLQPPVKLDKKKSSAAGVHHSAYTFASLAELLARYEKLAAVGIVPAQPIQHGVTTSLYYRDPDDNFVELQVDNFESAAAATAYMKGPEYGADSVGVGFSPAKMVEALRKGVPDAVLKTRKWALEASPDLPNPLVELTR